MTNEFGADMPYPTPLYFQVPSDVLHDALTAPFCEIDPTFLCFEPFYQAVALTWPYRYNVIDVGGYVGAQGWLFKDFERYIDVDLRLRARRCALPPNGRHVEMDGREYLAQFHSFRAAATNDLFICSAVPDREVREAVMAMPNHVVWYPGREMHVSGPFGSSTVEAFERLDTKRQSKRREMAVMEAIEGELSWI